MQITKAFLSLWLMVFGLNAWAQDVKFAELKESMFRLPYKVDFWSLRVDKVMNESGRSMRGQPIGADFSDKKFGEALHFLSQEIEVYAGMVLAKKHPQFDTGNYMEKLVGSIFQLSEALSHIANRAQKSPLSKREVRRMVTRLKALRPLYVEIFQNASTMMDHVSQSVPANNIDPDPKETASLLRILNSRSKPVAGRGSSGVMCFGLSATESP